jgi:hypothetical protein
MRTLPSVLVDTTSPFRITAVCAIIIVSGISVICTITGSAIVGMTGVFGVTGNAVAAGVGGIMMGGIDVTPL